MTSPEVMPSSPRAPTIDGDTVTTASTGPVWRPTLALHASLLVGLVLATVGVLASRVDVVLLALPFLVSAAIALDRAPDERAESTLHVYVTRSTDVTSAPAFEYRVVLVAPAATEFVQLRLITGGVDRWELLLAPNAERTVTGRVPVQHSGRQPVVSVAYRLFGPDGAWASRPVPATLVERVVAPAIVPLEALPLPHRLTGLTGTHESVRPGDGGEFRDVHPYASGDRLRRIDWKATARRSQGLGDLYVRRTNATADATLLLVIDSLDDIGERVASWSFEATERGVTSMDLAREAAASIAAAAIRTGDRVGLLDLAAQDGVVAAGGGRRHLDRLLRRLAASEPMGTRLTRRRAPVVPAGAIVYVFTTLLDDEAAALSQRWRASGHRVVVVDVLPTPRLDFVDRHTGLAHRLVLAERRQRLDTLRANGIDVLRWPEDAHQPARAVAMRALATRAFARGGRARAGQGG